MASVSESARSPVDAERGVESRLRRLWTRQTGRLVLRGACWLAAAGGALLLADLLLDWQLDLWGTWRLALLAANLVLLAAVAWRTLLRHLRAYDAVDQALHVERAWPELNGLVVSSVQFGESQQAAPGVSRELMRAVRRQAIERTAALDFGRLTRRIALRGAVACMAIALAAVTAVGLWRPDFLGALALRMAHPFSELAYPTRTRIELLAVPEAVRAGEPVTLAARASGEVPEHGQVLVRVKGSPWEAVELDARPDAGGAAAEFRYVLPRAGDDFEYAFHLGDARSPRRQVKVARPPRIVQGHVELAYPQYTGMKEQTVDTLNLKVPEGTRLRWQVKLDRAVQSAELRREGTAPLAMSLSPDGCEARVQATAEASRPYTLQVAWPLGERTLVEPLSKHYIQVIPDADPQAGLLEPAEDSKATLKKTTRLAYWARDDYGLGEAWIAYSVNDMSERRDALGSLGGAADVQRRYSWPITRQLPTLKLNDIVTFAVEVTDGRPGAPGRARSIARRVQFVSDAEYVDYILARQRKLLGRLRPLYLQEREAAARLERLPKSPSELGQQAALEAARQDVVATQLAELIDRFGQLLADLGSNEGVGLEAAKIAEGLQARLATVRDVRLAAARKWIDEALREPPRAAARLAQAHGQIELAARELGSLLIQAGFSQACEVFAAELRQIAVVQDAFQAAASAPSAKPSPEAADAQRALAQRVEKLVEALRALRDVPADALAAVRLQRARKIVERGKTAAEMRQAAEELAAAPASAAARQARVLKAIREALLKLRPDARLEELIRARNLLAGVLDAQKVLRTQVVQLAADDLAQRKAALKFRQEAILRPALQLAGGLDIETPLAAADRAGQEAAAALGAADATAATAAQQRAETSLGSAIAALAGQIERYSALGETHKQMLEAAQRMRALSELRDRGEQIKNAAFDPAGTAKGLAPAAAAQQQLAKDLAAWADGLPATSKFAAAIRRPLRKTAQAAARAAVAMNANGLDAAMPELLKAEQSLKDALDIAKRELGVLEKVWLFRQASADLKQIALTIDDLAAEQADLRGDADAAQRERRGAAELAGPQGVLARAVAQVQDSVAAIGEAGAMKDPLDAAANAMRAAAGQLEKNQPGAAIASQQQAAAALQDARKTSLRLVSQIDLMVVEIAAASELNSRAMDLLQRQIELRETTEEAELPGFGRLAVEQDALGAEATVLAGMSAAPKAAEAFQRAADEMTAALRQLKASARQPAVEHQKKAEDALLAGILAMEEFLRSMISMTQQPGQFVNAFDGMTAVLLLATEQRELRELVERSAAASLPAHAGKQAELHARCLEVAEMPNVFEPTEPIVGRDHILAAAKAMQQALDALKGSVKPNSIEHQRLAEKELRIAFAMNLVAMVNAAHLPPQIPLPELPPPPVQPPATISLEHWVEFAKASPTGNDPKGSKAEWNSLMERHRAALNENFARELPLEFRKLLKDYYEALAK